MILSYLRILFSSKFTTAISYFKLFVSAIKFVLNLKSHVGIKKSQVKEIHMTELYGIANIKKIFLFGLVCGTAADANIPAWKDKVTNTEDFAFLMKIFPAMGDLIGLQWNQIIPELKDVSADEQQELYVFFKDHLDIRNKTLEAVLEEGLGMVSDIVGLVQKMIALVKKLKTPAAV